MKTKMVVIALNQKRELVLQLVNVPLEDLGQCRRIASDAARQHGNDPLLVVKVETWERLQKLYADASKRLDEIDGPAGPQVTVSQPAPTIHIQYRSQMPAAKLDPNPWNPWTNTTLVYPESDRQLAENRVEELNAANGPLEYRVEPAPRPLIKALQHVYNGMKGATLSYAMNAIAHHTRDEINEIVGAPVDRSAILNELNDMIQANRPNMLVEQALEAEAQM